MSDQSDNPPVYPLYEPEGPQNSLWSKRVVYSRRDGGYARHHGEVICIDEPTLALVESITGVTAATGKGTNGSFGIDVGGDEREYLHRFEEHPGLSVEDVVEMTRDHGGTAEPNYVMFANPVYANPVYANPVYANPVYANPVYANPVYANAKASGSFANPVYANPVYASPVYANPVYANPVYANAYICSGERPSTARPAATQPIAATPPDGDAPGQIFIMDSGISEPGFCPPLLSSISAANPLQRERPDNSGDGYLDPISGHGTFIVGIIKMLAPSQPDKTIHPECIVGSYGDVDVLTVIARVAKLLSTAKLNASTIVNMSFGGYADEHMRALARAVRRIQRTGAVVVASAGNDATSRPLFPACLPDVVGVASLDPYGPAAYTNHGPWVSACAPGTDLVSSFYQYNGQMELRAMPGSSDPDKYEHWARWTGTSFAAPVVSAALLRHMAATQNDSAAEAVEHVVNAPGLFRLPELGTVVNISTAGPSCI